MATIQFPFSPLIYFPIQISLIASLIAFSSPTSLLRPSLLPIVVICNYSLLSSYSSYIPRPPWIGFVSGATLGGLLDYVEKLLLSQWSYAHYGPNAQAVTVAEKADKKWDSRAFSSRQSNGEGSIWEHLKFGYWAAISSRYIDSPYQARNVLPYSYSNPSFVPTRSAFVLKRASTFIICYLTTDLLAQGNEPDKSPTVYAESRVPFFTRLHDVTMDEMVTRTITSVFYWIGAYVAVQAYYTGLALLSVISGLDHPGLWRPNFGPVNQVHTIRGFWGHFWHQFMRKKLTKPARYITFRIIGLPRSSATNSRILKLLARYTETFIVFLISGVLHHTIEVAQGLAWSESGATTFFVMMAAGIMLEDAVQWVFYDLIVGREKRGQWWGRAIGYVWVLGFFAYATPFWAYPSLRKNTGGRRNELVPVSLIGTLKG